MQTNIELKQLEDKLQSIKSEKDTIEGQCSLLDKQCITSEHKLEDLEHDKELYKKSVELLTVVEQSTKDIIKKGFEKIVTYALQYILANDEYALKLEFSRRGNLSEVNFNTLTPKNKEPHEPGGFVTDILALALRLSLIELTRPKIEGFICLDEPFSAIDDEKKYDKDIGAKKERTRNFLKNMTRKMNRQFIISTHQKELITDADKAIKIGDKNE